MAHYGESGSISIPALNIKLEDSVYRSVAILDFSRQNVGRINVTFERTDDQQYAKRKVQPLKSQINSKRPETEEDDELPTE